jgi:predicted negative regulator of RcsB-dependent stress response
MPPLDQRFVQSAPREVALAEAGVSATPHSISPPAPDPSARDLLHLGLQRAEEGDLNAAAELLAQSILKDPLSADAHEALATVMLALDNMEFACKAKAKAVGLGYNSSADWELLGDMFVALGQPDDAAQAFGTALVLEPDSAELERKLRIAAAASSFAPANRDDTISGFPNLADLALADEQKASGEIPAAWRRVNLITIEPADHPHAAAFADLTSAFETALRSLGIVVHTRKNEVGLEGVNLLFGGHLITSQESADRIPNNTVVVNLEQLRGFNISARPIYTSLLRRLAVWDYSPRNIEQIKTSLRNPHVSHFSIGYTPEMTRRLAGPQTTDVLFYGSLNDRRAAILQGLRQAGVNVKHLFSVYGEDRDAAIADAKIVLNMHYYEDSIHEIVRTSYLLANGKAVVSECGPDTEIDDDIRQALIAVPYKDIVANCVALISDEPRRQALERKALEIFAKRDQAAMLRDAITATTLPAI